MVLDHIVGEKNNTYNSHMALRSWLQKAYYYFHVN